MPAAHKSPQQLAALVDDFLTATPLAVAIEEGSVIFDFAHARYSVSSDLRCVLHMWSDDRNAVRRVVDAELTARILRLQVLRFGQSQPIVLELSADRDRRSGAARRSLRAQYLHLLERVLARDFPAFKIEHLSVSPDLEHSISPVYGRALLRSGQTAFAVLGVGCEETQTAVDAALTFGVLWMDHQRQRLAGRAVVEGLKLFLPPGRSDTVRQRASHLDPDAAKWQAYELDERSTLTEPLDLADSGNIITRLNRCLDRQSAAERFAGSIARIHELAPEATVSVDSASEIIFRQHGLEFARARMAASAGSYRNSETVVFGTGAAEYTLDDKTDTAFRDLLARMVKERRAGGAHADLYFRMAPERWLESLVVNNVAAVDERLDPSFVYSQVPAFAALDRAMLDVLTCTRDGRLAVLELKADEDIHLPLQGLDYWGRVRWLQQHGEFERQGYFHQHPISSAPPLLYLVAPALRTHPSTDVLLRYLSPRIEWELVQVDERWRNGVRVVNRKHRRQSAAVRLPSEAATSLA